MADVKQAMIFTRLDRFLNQPQRVRDHVLAIQEMKALMRRMSRDGRHQYHVRPGDTEEAQT